MKADSSVPGACEEVEQDKDPGSGPRDSLELFQAPLELLHYKLRGFYSVLKSTKYVGRGDTSFLNDKTTEQEICNLLRRLRPK